MKFPALMTATLLLASCGSGSDGGATSVETGQPSAPASSQAAADPLLDGLVTPQQQGKYAPRDECGKLAGAREFREKLAQAVANNDAAAIAAMASPVIKLGFGGDDGRERFVEKLKAPDGEMIKELAALLPLGCAATGEDGLTIPWHFAQDMGDIDGYSATIVTGADVPLYAKADASSAVSQKLSWDVVLLNAGLYPERPFQQVETRDGKKGFVATDKLRSLLDYRLLANRENGEWKITALLAGD